MYGNLVTAMVTPFMDNGNINYQEIPKLVNYLIDNGTDALLILGTTGESPTLSKHEKISFIKYVKKIVKDRIPIIVGVGSNNTADTVEFAKRVEKMGVNGLLVVAPYYNKPNQEGIYEHFKAVDQAVKTPIMIYNIPSRTGINIEYETLVKLSKLRNIKALKYSYDDIDTVKKLIDNTDLYVYSGDDIMTLDFINVGGEGVVSVASHIIGKEIKAVMTSKSEKQMNKLKPIIRLLFDEPNPAPVKYALRKKGIKVGKPRLPLVDITTKLKTKIKKEI